MVSVLVSSTAYPSNLTLIHIQRRSLTIGKSLQCWAGLWSRVHSQSTCKSVRVVSSNIYIQSLQLHIWFQIFNIHLLLKSMYFSLHIRGFITARLKYLPDLKLEWWQMKAHGPCTFCCFKLPWLWRRCCRAWLMTTWWTVKESAHPTTTGPFPVRPYTLASTNWRSSRNRWEQSGVEMSAAGKTNTSWSWTSAFLFPVCN